MIEQQPYEKPDDLVRISGIGEARIGDIKSEGTMKAVLDRFEGNIAVILVEEDKEEATKKQNKHHQI